MKISIGYWTGTQIIHCRINERHSRLTTQIHTLSTYEQEEGVKDLIDKGDMVFIDAIYRKSLTRRARTNKLPRWTCTMDGWQYQAKIEHCKHMLLFKDSKWHLLIKNTLVPIDFILKDLKQLNHST